MEENTNQHVIIFEIKPKRALTWKKWCRLLSSTYRSEVQKSLLEERNNHEMFIIFELNGKTYGLAYIEGRGLPYNERREVNRIHDFKTKTCLKRVSKANILYSIKNVESDHYSGAYNW